ncbi:acyl carrier protein [Streptomyces monticola]|uniref:Acyl carrier protein n=1 Tax=Streptomyces monticola TaxID=2666263 RepID=A0ABW2JVV3_9ACTN
MDQAAEDWIIEASDDLDDLDGLGDFDDFGDFGDFDDLPPEWDPAAAESAPPSLSELAAAGLPERTDMIDAYVRHELARVLRVPPDEIDTAGCTMNSLGIGSINGLELQRRMEDVLRVDVNLQQLLRANSAAELIDCLAGQLGPEQSPHKNPSRGHGHASGETGAP